MLKKLASLLLSLLPGQAGVADAPEGGSLVQMEASEAARPDEPVMPMAEEFPGKDTIETTDETTETNLQLRFLFRYLNP